MGEDRTVGGILIFLYLRMYVQQLFVEKTSDKEVTDDEEDEEKEKEDGDEEKPKVEEMEVGDEKVSAACVYMHGQIATFVPRSPIKELHML